VPPSKSSSPIDPVRQFGVARATWNRETDCSGASHDDIVNGMERIILLPSGDVATVEISFSGDSLGTLLSLRYVCKLPIGRDTPSLDAPTAWPVTVRLRTSLDVAVIAHVVPGQVVR
jgi:hypothetical protein